LFGSFRNSQQATGETCVQPGRDWLTGLPKSPAKKWLPSHGLLLKSRGGIRNQTTRLNFTVYKSALAFQ
jgi:hypothetical protein